MTSAVWASLALGTFPNLQGDIFPGCLSRTGTINIIEFTVMCRPPVSATIRSERV